MMERLDELISAYFDDALKDGELEELKGFLCADRECVIRFCDQAELEQELRELTEGVVPSVKESPHSERGSRMSWWAVAALVLVGLSLAGFFFAQSGEPKVLADFKVSPHGRITVSGPGEERGNDGELVEGSTIRVVQGSAEIQFREGVRCLIEAPAELVLEREGLVILRDGRARFDVEDQAKGFQVISGDLHLTDLGTSFGVDASRSAPEVHVLSGLVIGQDARGNREGSRMEGGQAMVLVGDGGLTPIPIDVERFSPTLGKGIPALYLCFDDIKKDAGICGGSIANRDGVQLSMNHKNAPEVGEGRFGKALKFDGKKAYARTNWPGVSGSKARSVSFWIKASESNRANPILGWGLESGGEQMSFFGLRLGASGHLRIVSGNRWLEGSFPMDRGKWHHVVVVTGDYTKGAWPVTRVYVNGKRDYLVPQVPMDQEPAGLETFSTVIDHPDSEPLMIGRFRDTNKSKPWHLESFSGLIDEVIVAEGLIDEAGAKALYEGRLIEAGLDITDLEER